MKIYTQILVSLVLAVFLALSIGEVNKTTTQIVVSDTGYLMAGDVLTFSQPQAIVFEAIGDDEFTFITDDRVIESEPFASKHRVETVIIASQVRLVEGSTSIEIYSLDKEEFRYTYDPGSTTARTSFLVFFFLWVLVSFLAVVLIELIASSEF